MYKDNVRVMRNVTLDLPESYDRSVTRRHKDTYLDRKKLFPSPNERWKRKD